MPADHPRCLRVACDIGPVSSPNFPISPARGGTGVSTRNVDYYSDDYPDASLEDFLALYKRLSKYAQREVHDLAESLAVGSFVTEGPTTTLLD